MTDRKDDDATPETQPESATPEEATPTESEAGPWSNRDADDAEVDDLVDFDDRAETAEAEILEAEPVEATSADDGAAAFEAPPPEPEPEPAAAKKSGGAGRWLLAVLIAFLIGAATWPVLSPLLPPGLTGRDADATAERLAALQSQLSALEDSVAALQAPAEPDPQITRLLTQVELTDEVVAALENRLTELASAPPAEPDTSVIEERIAVLASRIDAIENRPPVTVSGDGEIDLTPLLARLDELESRLTTLGQANGASDEIAGLRTMGLELEGRMEALSGQLTALQPATDRIEALAARLAEVEAAAGRATPGERRDAFVLALSQLRGAVERGGAYADDLAAAARLADGVGDAETAAPLAALEQWATDGVPTLRQLRRRFAREAGEIVAAARRNPDADWVERTVERLTSAVKVRRIGDAEGDTVDALVARAEGHLAAGDLAAAVNELTALEGGGAEVAAPWLAGARAHLDAMAALDGLQARAIAQLGGG